MKETLQEFLNNIKLSPYIIYGKSDFISPSRHEYMGKAIVFVTEGVIYFEKCAYCGSTDKLIVKNLLEQDCCGHCNAPIRWNDYQ